MLPTADVAVLVSASRPFFLAALQLRLDSASAVSGRGSQGPAGAGGLEDLLRSGKFRCEWLGVEQYRNRTFADSYCRIAVRDTE